MNNINSKKLIISLLLNKKTQYENFLHQFFVKTSLFYEPFVKISSQNFNYCLIELN